MPILDVRIHQVSAALHTPFVTALRTADAVETVIVEIVDEDGRSGFGEAPQVWQVTGASMAANKVHVIRTIPGQDEPVVIEVSLHEAKRQGRGNLRLSPGDVVS